MAEMVHEPFNKLCPPTGWLADYVSYTSWNEAPTSFHYFVGCAILGAALNRQIYFKKGYYSLYPNLQLILVAPTGRCRKTTASNIGIRCLQQLNLVNIIQDKTTPEALLESLDIPVGADFEDGNINIEKPDAHAMIHAPELAVMLGKQRYNEGMIALLTSLFDSPDIFTTRTKQGGTTELQNVTIIFVGASTPDWLITSIPQDAFGGGFMSRILFIAEEDTPRCFPIPVPPADNSRIVEHLQRILNNVHGSMDLDAKAENWFTLWYTASRDKIPEDSKMAGYHERKPDHLLRLAMIHQAAQMKTTIDTTALIRCSKQLEYLETNMLETFKWLGVKAVGQDQERLIRAIRSMNNRAEHSELLARMIFFMDVRQFRICIDTLVEAKKLKENVINGTKYYSLTDDA